MFRYSLSLVLVSFSAFSFAQTVSVPAPASKASEAVLNANNDEYKNEAVVIERDDTVYRYKADGTGSKRETAVMHVQSASALQSLAVLNFAYASSSQQVSLSYARVRKADGTVVETPVDTAQDQPAPVTQAAPMYSDLRIRQLPLRSLGIGDRVEFEVTTTDQTAEIPGHFWASENLGANAVYLERTLELHFPTDKSVTVWSPSLKATVTQAQGETTYVWKGSQLKPTPDPSDKQAVAQQKAASKLAPIAWTTFPSWQAVGEWYRALSAGRDDPTDAIRARATELTATAATDTDKVRALYEYVSTHNHYIGVSFGIGRYQPHTAAEVLANQYGDCKDKHTLLSALLKSLGYKVSAVLIGAGVELNESVPMPGAFNHLITQVELDGHPVWLDATAEIAPYRVLLPLLRDKQALVIPPAPAAPHLEKTPALPPTPTNIVFTATGTLSKEGSLTANMDISLQGDQQVDMRAALRQVAPAQWNSLAQFYSNLQGFSGTVSDAVFDLSDKLSAPLHFQYKYAKAPYGDWEHYRVIGLLPFVMVPAYDKDGGHDEAIDLGVPGVQTATSTIHLPEGFSADLPSAVHVKSKWATYDGTYQFKDGDLISRFRIEVLQPKVPAAEREQYKKFMDDMGDRPWIQLVGNHAVGETGPPSAGSTNPVAAELIRQGVLAMQDQDFDLATQKFDQASAINSKEQGLWAARSMLAFSNQKVDEAIADMKKEIEFHPELVSAYTGLFGMQLSAKKTEDAYKTLNLWLAAAGSDPQQLVSIASGFVSVKHFDEAITQYKAVLKHDPKNIQARSGLGGALYMDNRPQEAVVVLKSAIESTNNPDDLNNIAYMLSLHNSALPQAEEASLKAISQLETASTSYDLAEANSLTFAQASLLLAAWDTLGWIYFDQGKFTQAEPYLQAAWINYQSVEAGYHVGKLQEKLHRPEAAMRTYELALAANPPGTTTEFSTLVQASIDALKQQGIRSQTKNGMQELQQERTFHIPRPPALHGSAVITLLASPAGTQKMQLASGDAQLTSQLDTLRKLDLHLNLPPTSKGLLLRSGMLACMTQTTCDFVLLSPDSADVR